MILATLEIGTNLTIVLCVAIICVCVLLSNMYSDKEDPGA